MAYTDPNAPFVARQLFTALSGQRITINDDTHPNGIAFYSGDIKELTPAQIQPSDILGNVFGLAVTGATSPNNAAAPTLSLTTDDVTPRTEFGSHSDRLNLGATTDAFIQSPSIKIGDFTTQRILISGTPSIASIEGEVWHTTADTALSNSWVDTAGARFGYYKDATGNAHLRGLVRNGTAAGIVTLPAGYRPSSNLDFTVQNKNGNGIASIGITTAGVVSISTNFVANTMQVYLDVINYPTA